MSFQLVPVGSEIAKLVVETRDASIDLSKISITISRATEDDLQMAEDSAPADTERLRQYVKRNESRPYRGTRPGAFEGSPQC